MRGNDAYSVKCNAERSFSKALVAAHLIGAIRYIGIAFPIWALIRAIKNTFNYAQYNPEPCIGLNIYAYLGAEYKLQSPLLFYPRYANFTPLEPNQVSLVFKAFFSSYEKLGTPTLDIKEFQNKK